MGSSGRRRFQRRCDSATLAHTRYRKVRKRDSPRNPFTADSSRRYVSWSRSSTSVRLPTRWRKVRAASTRVSW